jgi:hypothetical protein
MQFEGRADRTAPDPRVLPRGAKFQDNDEVRLRQIGPSAAIVYSELRIE